jgi:hypothetical protein
MQNVRINKAYGHLKMKRLVKKEEKTTHIETHDFFFANVTCISLRGSTKYNAIPSSSEVMTR